jgi:ribulose bisphosphate carboxylase small subunit
MINYIITHGCDTKEEFCACKKEIKGTTVQEVISCIENIEKEYPVYAIRKLIIDSKAKITEKY